MAEEGGSAADVCGVSVDAWGADWLNGVVDDLRKVRVPFVVRPSRRDLVLLRVSLGSSYRESRTTVACRESDCL